MPVVARADERVYIIDRAGRPRRARKEPEGQQGEGKFLVMAVSVYAPRP